MAMRLSRCAVRVGALWLSANDRERTSWAPSRAWRSPSAFWSA